MLLDYISKNDNFVLVKEYCDEDLSGAGTYRPAFENLIKDCENGKIDVVLCKSQSRFSRDMEIIEKYLNNKFLEWNVRFISLTDNADTENKGNKKARQINGLVNEWYLEDLSNNIRSAFYTKMNNGEFISPFSVFGYEISKEDKNKLVVDNYAKEIVIKIFNLYLDGNGYSTIANILNKEKIPSPSYYKYLKGCKLNVVSNKPRDKIKWSGNAIKTILKNEIYTGCLVQGKRTTVSYKNHKIIRKNKEKWIKTFNSHEAIIDINIFNKVQQIINEKHHPVSKGKVHLFSKKVYCNNCNSLMRKKKSSKYDYLVCSNSINTCPNKKGIRYDVLEKVICDEINKYITSIDLTGINFEENEDSENRLRYLLKEKEEKEKYLKKCDFYLQNIYEDKVNKLITIDEFQKLKETYKRNNVILKRQINDIELNIEKVKKISTKKENNISEINFIKIDRYIIDNLIEKVFISKEENNERTIKIIWNF